jgi:hypothetical protein
MACYLVGGCCDATVTGKQEGVGFNHNAGAQHDPVPLFAVCVLKVTIVPQIKNTLGVWVTATTGQKIIASPLSRKPNASRPCVKNASFTWTPQVGSGGATYNCRYKMTTRANTAYCYFNVTVDAPPVTLLPGRTLTGAGL